MKQLMKSLNGGARTWVREQAFGEDVALMTQFEAVRKARGITGIQARMPFDMVVY